MTEKRPKVTAIVWPCENFKASRDEPVSLSPHRFCASCGFCESIHGKTGAELIAEGLYDPSKDTPGMEEDPSRLAFLKLEQGLAEAGEEITAHDVVRAVIAAPCRR